MLLHSDMPFDGDEATSWLQDSTATLVQKIAAAAWFTEEGVDSNAIGQRVGLSASTIRHWARLSRKLAPPMLERLRRPVHSVSMGHLKALAALPYPMQLTLLERCIAHRLSVRRLETLAQTAGAFADRDEETHYAHLSDQMSLKLGFDVMIRPERGKRGAGKITIPFHSLDDFDALCSRLGVDLSDL